MSKATVNDYLKVIEDFLLLLTQKERYVIERRFNLDQKEKSTLEEIGQKYSVTRERIRQIEKNALNKLRRNLDNAPLSTVSNSAYEVLKNAGGVMIEDMMIAELLKQYPEHSRESIQLILSIDKRYNRIPNTVHFHPYIVSSEFKESMISGLCKNSISQLKKNRDIMTVDALYKVLVENKGLEISKEGYKSLLYLDKKIKLVDENSLGLSDWRHINPRTLRDKIFFILRSEKSPMHFVEIANRIIEAKFDKKNINLQAVHNELIRHPDFVLIGRGIYGLSEWGFKPGTVADIITDLLRGKESLSQEEIIDAVLKQRKVKPITIILSLKSKDQFIRVGRKQYSLVTA